MQVAGETGGTHQSYAVGNPRNFSPVGIAKRQQQADHVTFLLLQAVEVTLGGWVCTDVRDIQLCVLFSARQCGHGSQL